MRSFLSSLFILLFATGYVWLLFYYTDSNLALQTITILLLIIFLLIIFFFPNPDTTSSFKHYKKHLFLFASTVFVQVMVFSTGNLTSPLFILIHLFIIGISFLYDFPIALAFVVFVLGGSFFQIAMTSDLADYLLNEFPSFILPLASLIPILPVAYILSQEYRFKNKLAEKLNFQVKTDKSIFADVKELIIVTDPTLKILTANDAVERTLLRPMVELKNKYLFDVLFLRDAAGKLVTKDVFFAHDTFRLKKAYGEFTLLRSSVPFQKVRVHITPTTDIDGNYSQLSIIVSFTNTTNTLTNSEKSRIKYEALLEEIKKDLNTDELHPIKSKVALLEKIENDIYLTNLLENKSVKKHVARVDLAKLCRQVTKEENDFARVFSTSVTFAIKDFTQKDIEHLTVANYPIEPSQLTGPFFTIKGDITLLEVYLEKLIDLAIILSSITKKSEVAVSIKRQQQATYLVTVTAPCSMFSITELKENIFLPYFGNLNTKINMVHASGLEGYLITLLQETLGISFAMTYADNQIIFTSTIRSL